MSIAYDKSRVKILVVDDEDSIREMLMLTLQEDGWDVSGASNGKEAVEKLKADPAHIVMSDINMPEMTGVELLEHVKSTYARTEFVIMTSHATLETAVKAIKLGAYDYLNKPFEDLSIVPKKIEQVAEKILLRQQNEELLKRLKVASRELRNLLEAITPLSSLLKKEELREGVVSKLPKLFGKQDLKASWWVEEEGRWKCVAAQPNLEAFSEAAEPGEIEEKVPGLQNLCHMPLQYKSSTREYLVYEAPQKSFSDLLRHQVETYFQKVCFHEEIASLANRDGLTRLYNHRHFQERLRQEFSQARRQKSGMSVVLMDVDNFKQYNDQNGHPAGDELLSKLARLLDSETKSSETDGRRVTDIVARYGGEEFVMILPFTLYEGALVKAERVRKAIEAYEFQHREKQPLGCVSVSIGVASFPDHADSPEDLVRIADRALYKAKELGRNRVVGASDLEGVDQASSSESQAPVDLQEIEVLASEEIVDRSAVPSPPPPPPEEIFEDLEKSADHQPAPVEPEEEAAAPPPPPPPPAQETEESSGPTLGALLESDEEPVSETTGEKKLNNPPPGKPIIEKTADEDEFDIGSLVSAIEDAVDSSLDESTKSDLSLFEEPSPAAAGAVDEEAQVNKKGAS